MSLKLFAGATDLTRASAAIGVFRPPSFLATCVPTTELGSFPIRTLASMIRRPIWRYKELIPGRDLALLEQPRVSDYRLLAGATLERHFLGEMRIKPCACDCVDIADDFLDERAKSYRIWVRRMFAKLGVLIEHWIA